MLDRILLHQTRLRIPGVGLDARGIALGARGLVLLPSLDRLVAFLAIYTQAHTLDALLGSLSIEVLRSKLGTRDIAFGFEAGSSDRMDAIADVARLTGGFTFTGTSRHFVQYRDASAPFGYDVRELTPTNAALAVHHSTFSQVYEIERALELRALLLRLAPRPDPSRRAGQGPIWLLAEAGIGPSLISYLGRSGVDAEVALVEWPPESRLEDTPVRRWLFRIEDLPRRMQRLLSSMPGLAVFLPSRSGAAVQAGYTHPVDLRGCPVFDEQGLVLFRGQAAPISIERLPLFARLSSFRKSELLPEQAADPPRGAAGAGSMALRVRLRLVPDAAPIGRVTASFVPNAELGMLRRLAYALGPRAIAGTRLAVTADGAYLTSEAGLEPLPLGVFYRSVHEAVFVPAGLSISPAVSADAIFEALGAPRDRLLFFRPDGTIAGVLHSAFVALDRALLESERWAPVDAASWQELAQAELPTLRLEPLGLRPLSGVEPLP